MSGNRMSILDVAEYCGHAGTVGGQSAGGRDATMGSAWHACCSDDDDKDDWLLKLTPKELEEISEWNRPADLVFTYRGVEFVCKYEHAMKEQTVALNDMGRSVKEDDPKVMTVGHYDMGWIVEGSYKEDGETHHFKLAVIGDIKRSAFTVDGPDTLQNAGYGHALADKHDCDGYVSGIWAATEAYWQISEVKLLLESGDTWKRVKHAAQNTDDRPTMGDHCRKCYGWQRCSAYTMVGTSAEALKQMQDGMEITDETALGMMVQAEAMGKAAELTKKRLKLWAEKNPIRNGTGKVWRMGLTKGKQSVMGVKKLQEAMGEKEAAKYITRGAPIPRFAWVNEEKSK